jgi:hypothetical protein
MFSVKDCEIKQKANSSWLNKFVALFWRDDVVLLRNHMINKFVRSSLVMNCDFPANEVRQYKVVLFHPVGSLENVNIVRKI